MTTAQAREQVAQAWRTFDEACEALSQAHLQASGGGNASVAEAEQQKTESLRALMLALTEARAS